MILKKFLRSYGVMAMSASASVSASDDILVQRQQLEYKCTDVYKIKANSSIP